MTKDLFKEIVNLQKQSNEYIDACKNLNIDIVETPIVNFFWRLLDIVFVNSYTEQGCDWINWYLYEKGENEGLLAYKDDKPFLTTIDELWEYVELNYKINE